ncbi:hypothetical protein [Desulfobulbus rhabdoformis]|uniref:COG4705 family protein n=1 Tax=Desulfobulbus rhabdoformis TaxID=34032 RepID=UPI001F06AABC|nr:hypothetical protein [Desulfobulbus rhabdoformis]
MKNSEKLLSKVPEVTLYFWIIKVLCTTVGETAADFLNMSLGLGLIGTSVIMGGLLVMSMVFQYRASKYIPSVYWLTVVLVSVFGTLVTDLLTDNMHVPLETSTIFFSLALAITFSIWFVSEKTLSIHSIFTVRRETFYWLAILFTFALGTATGDLMAESLGLGYLTTGFIVCSVVAIMGIAWKLGLDSILSFWIVYIMTRPLGASLGDYLSQSTASGGVGLGPTMTSALFLAAIVLTVIFLSITKRDMIAGSIKSERRLRSRNVVFAQVIFVLIALLSVSWGGYYWRNGELTASLANKSFSDKGRASATVSSMRPLGDLSLYRTISVDSLALVDSGKFAEAKSRVRDLESAWDRAAGRLRAMDKEIWTKVDDAIDSVLHNLRAFHPDTTECHASLLSLITTIDALDPSPLPQ